MLDTLKLTMTYYTNQYGQSYGWFVKVNDQVFDAAAMDNTYDQGDYSNCLAYLEIKFDRYKVKFLGS